MALDLEPTEVMAVEGPVWTAPTLFLADRLLSLTLLAFESLNTATCKDRCLACIEEPFFSPLWPLLLALYRYAPSPPNIPRPGVCRCRPALEHCVLS